MTRKYAIVVTPGTVLRMDSYPEFRRTWLMPEPRGRIVSICDVTFGDIPTQDLTSGLGRSSGVRDEIAIRPELTLDDFEIEEMDA